MSRASPAWRLPIICLALTGCADLPYDYDGLDRLDRIDVRAGDAQQRNITLQTVDPLPAGKHAVIVSTDGKRTMAVMEDYYDRSPPADAEVQAVGEILPPEPADGDGGDS